MTQQQQQQRKNNNNNNNNNNEHRDNDDENEHNESQPNNGTTNNNESQQEQEDNVSTMMEEEKEEEDEATTAHSLKPPHNPTLSEVDNNSTASTSTQTLKKYSVVSESSIAQAPPPTLDSFQTVHSAMSTTSTTTSPMSVSSVVSKKTTAPPSLSSMLSREEAIRSKEQQQQEAKFVEKPMQGSAREKSIMKKELQQLPKVATVTALAESGINNLYSEEEQELENADFAQIEQPQQQIPLSPTPEQLERLAALQQRLQPQQQPQQQHSDEEVHQQQRQHLQQQSQPGAYHQPGIAFGAQQGNRQQRRQRQRQRQRHVTIIDSQSNLTPPTNRRQSSLVGFARLVSARFQPSSRHVYDNDEELAHAEQVLNDATLVEYAEEVSPDYSRKIKRIMVGLCILTVLLTTALVLILTQSGKGSGEGTHEIYNPLRDIDDRCVDIPIEDQTIDLHCLCYKNTSLFLTIRWENSYNENLKVSKYDSYDTIIDSLDTVIDTEILYTTRANQNHTCTPLNQAIIALADILDLDSTFLIDTRKPHLHQHLFALVFYFSTGGVMWTNRDGWMTSPIICDAHGVDCPILTRIGALRLSNNNLQGTIPDSIQTWAGLREIDFSVNDGLYGQLPTFPTKLEILQVYSTSISGSIPTSIGLVDRLDILSIADCQLTGTIPTEIGNLTLIRQLDLNYNQLSGSLPSEIGQLENIRRIRIQNNTLTGTIPVEIENMHNIEIFNIGFNDLNGTVPSALGVAEHLEYMNLLGSGLTGELPEMICYEKIGETTIITYCSDITCSCCTLEGSEDTAQQQDSSDDFPNLPDMTNNMMEKPNKDNGDNDEGSQGPPAVATLFCGESLPDPILSQYTDV